MYNNISFDVFNKERIIYFKRMYNLFVYDEKKQKRVKGSKKVQTLFLNN